MSCKRYRDALTDVAAGGPAPAGLEAHLASCEGCREELATLRRALTIADSEMARLAADEPSPALAARIRQSVGEPDAPRAWHLRWMWPAVAASVTLVVALAAWMIRAPARVAVDSRPPAAAHEGRPAEQGGRTSDAPGRNTPSPGARAFVPAREGSATAGARHRRQPARAVPAPPEVLVPPGEAEALVRFAAVANRDRHAPAAFLAAGRPSPELEEPAALVIEPLEIVPLDPAETPGT
jgi:hypothetical protein